jgi:DMSO/TMAO reductase YedYZ molybdopterin-dependent catalytic subunit
LETKHLNKKVTLAVTIIIVIAIALVASTYYLTNQTSQSTGTLTALPTGDAPSGELKITGDITQKTLTIADLEKMPLVSITYTIKGKTSTYLGVPLTDLLNKTDAPWDAGQITIIAKDTYSSTVNTYLAYNSTRTAGNEYIIAIAENGQWITNSSEGPLKFIAPGLTPNYNIKSVVEINVQPWTITVNHDSVITASNITSYGVKTVRATLATDCEPQRTSDWTGVTLESIMDSVSSSATKVSVTAVDGYSRDFTVEQVKSSGLLLAYQENGQPLALSSGRPYRLVVSTGNSTLAPYWIKNITEITVS